MKRTIRWNKIIKESANAGLADIERDYGKNVADALVQYCKEKDKKISEVTNLKKDKIGMTEWDWFQKWAKRTLKLNIYRGFSDDWRKELDDDARDSEIHDDFGKKVGKNAKKKYKGVKTYAAPYSSDYMMRESDVNGKLDENSIIDWIAEEIYECEWYKDSTFDDYNPILEIETTDGDRFEISVKKI